MDVQPKQQTPLPKLQIAILLLIQSTEPITATVIYPFIPEFVRSTGITGGDETKTGYYAGIIESCFFVSEALVCFSWGRASDIIGRRPVLLLAPFGLTLAMLGFGLSKTFWPLVLFRCLQGSFNGNMGVGKTVMMEITDSTNRADAFTLGPIMWSLGVTLGPMIGGLLADPAERWPDIAGKLSLLKEYPYFLPCAVAGLYAFAIYVLGYLGLKETLHSEAKNSEETESLIDSTAQPCETASHPDATLTEDTFDHSPDSRTPLNRSGTPRYGSSASDTTNIEQSPPTKPSLPSYAEIFTPRLKTVIINNCFLHFTEMSYAVLIPLVYSTSIPIGGLGFPPHTIGLIMGIFSLCNAFVQIFGLTKVLKKIGARRMYQIAYGSLFFDFLGLCLIRVVVKWEEKVTALVWGILIVQLCCACLINTAYNSSNLLIVESAHPGALGVVNGTIQMCSCISRCLAPLVASSLFSLSLSRNIAGGYFVDIMLMAITAIGILCSLRLHK